MKQILEDKDLLNWALFVLICITGWAVYVIVQIRRKRKKAKFDKNNEYVDTYQTTERPSYRK